MTFFQVGHYTVLAHGKKKIQKTNASVRKPSETDQESLIGFRFLILLVNVGSIIDMFLKKIQMLVSLLVCHS
jgi:hypothetical protein